MPKFESDPQFNIEALKEAQENKEREMTEAQEREQAATNSASRRKSTEISGKVLDLHIADSRRLNDYREGLLVEFTPNLADNVKEAQQSAQDELTDISERLEQMVKQRNDIEALVKGKNVVAPEVSQAMMKLDVIIEELSEKHKSVEEKIAQLADKFAEISSYLKTIEDLKNAIDATDKSIQELMEIPDVAELVYEQAQAENEIRKGFSDQAKRLLSRYRYSGESRNEAGQAFTSEVANDILSSEIERLGANKIQDPAERAKMIDRISRFIMEGIIQSKNMMPNDKQRWPKVEKNYSKEDKELILKGYMVSQLLDCADSAAYGLGATITHDDWYKHEQREIVFDEADRERVVAELVPIINKIKAASLVDSIRPYSESDEQKPVRSNPTSMYFRPNFYQETFDTTTQRTSLKNVLEKYGYTELQSGPFVPVGEAGLRLVPERKKAIADFRKIEKHYAEKVNTERKRLEKMRQERLKEIPVKIEELKMRLDQISPEKQAAALKKMESLKEKLTQISEQKNKASQVRARAEKQVESATSQFNSAGALAKRNFLGKGAARTNLETANNTYKESEDDLINIAQEMKRIEKAIEKLSADPAYIQASSGDDYGRESLSIQKTIRQLEESYADYQHNDFSASVELPTIVHANY